ncbi:hypothetical protein V6N12_007320 [Hibiscus sabdariffa]|uniref:Uncharacterized protein n=1 Tax=Hibiscus sabdariffa TaxID=183260 RepID=A0ABR2F1F6_9ROSI
MAQHSSPKMKECIEGESSSAQHQNYHHGQPRSLVETSAKENAKAKEDDSDTNPDLCVHIVDEREMRSLRLSEILGEDHDGRIGLDGFENT